MARRIKMAERKLEESSWLAQTLADKMRVEFDKNGPSIRWQCLHTFYIVVKEADDQNNPNIYRSNLDGKLEIIICDIPDLLQHGTDFDRSMMQARLRGLAERYKDENGNYLVSVKTTHDLNCATIKDVSKLLFEMSW